MSESPQPQYEPPLIRRSHVAVFIGGIAASFFVSLIGGLALVVWSNIFEGGSGLPYQSNPNVPYMFWNTAYLTMAICALNWYLFFITIPAAWLTIGLLSIILKVEKSLQPRSRFYNIGIISTVLAIFLTSTSLALVDRTLGFSGHLFASLGGAGLSALMIGTPAGLLTTFVYRSILRPPAYSPSSNP